MTYSQHNEDDLLFDYFKKEKNGIIVEIGAFDPKFLSNSRLFIENGWNAILIDMSPYNLVKFIEEYKNNSKILIIGGAISIDSDNSLSEVFLIPPTKETDGAVSTTESWHKNMWINKGLNANAYTKYFSSKISLDNLYSIFPKNIDIMSIDIEGLSANFILNFDFNKINVKALIVEHDNKKDLLVNFLKDKYDLISAVDENLIFLKK